MGGYEPGGRAYIGGPFRYVQGTVTTDAEEAWGIALVLALPSTRSA